jgi:hypothetical protein
LPVRNLNAAQDAATRSAHNGAWRIYFALA